MKKKYILPIIVIGCAILSALPYGCTSDKLPEPSLDFCDSLGYSALTYDADIRPIIEMKCMTDNDICHRAGSGLGDYSTYERMKIDLDNGGIHRQIFTLDLMPPNGEEDLTQEEKEQIQCWLGNDYPEN